jgi:hypothetical protein
MPSRRSTATLQQDAMLSDRRLRGWYREFNRRWFEDGLPEDVDVLYAPVEGCSGEMVPEDRDSFVIRINPRYQVCSGIARLTLLHEMVHVELWPYVTHGPKFEARMRKLAAAGAMRGLW